jgi:hypothetical protein
VLLRHPALPAAWREARGPGSLLNEPKRRHKIKNFDLAESASANSPRSGECRADTARSSLFFLASLKRSAAIFTFRKKYVAERIACVAERINCKCVQGAWV